MTHSLARFCPLAIVMALAVPVAAQQTNQTTQSLGTVRITTAVKANGEPLAPGTYTVRLTSESPKPAVGQTQSEMRWVEFVQSGQVKAREVATVLTTAEVQKVQEGKPPASGTAKVEMLKGNDYLRVWINRGGTHYLVHLAAS
jgi:hypothetical protein